MKSKLTVIFSVLLLSAVISCSEEESDLSATEVMLPIEEDIPYYDRDHILMEKGRLFSDLTEKPDELILLHQFLEDSDNITLERLHVIVDEPPHDSGFELISIGNGRLVILDTGRSHLIEYDLNDHIFFRIAEFGRGPGDIHFPLEIAKHDNLISILRQDGYISNFDCRGSPCVFDGAISIEFRPASFSPLSDGYAILSTPMSRGATAEDNDNGLGNFKPVRLVNNTGDEISAFGSIYDVKDQFILLDEFVSKGMVRYSPDNGLFIVAYSRFPFIYLYDAATMQMIESYEISDFILGKQNYRPDMGMLRIVLEDNSYIRNITLLDQDYLLIESMTTGNYDREDFISYFDFKTDYYFVHLRDKEAYYIGGYDGNRRENIGKSINIIPDGLIIYDYEDGSLFWATSSGTL